MDGYYRFLHKILLEAVPLFTGQSAVFIRAAIGRMTLFIGTWIYHFTDDSRFDVGGIYALPFQYWFISYYYFLGSFIGVCFYRFTLLAITIFRLLTIILAVIELLIELLLDYFGISFSSMNPCNS